MRNSDEPQPIDRLTNQLAGIVDQLIAASSPTYDQPTDGDIMRVVGSALGSIDQITATVIRLLQQTTHRGVIADEGIATSTWLRAHAGRTTADERMLTLAADRLTHMPAVFAWFADGTLSWSTVRGIIAATRNLTADQRTWVDSALADDRHRLLCLDADEIVNAVDRLADRARPDLQTDREHRNNQRQFLSVQPRLDGTATLIADLDAEAAATVLAALDSINLDDDANADDDSDWRQRRSRSNAEKLVAIAQSHLGGGDRRRARPSMLVITDINALAGENDVLRSSTELLWTLHHTPIELTANAAQRLACDATLRHIIVDGSTVLGATAAHPTVSASLRAALIARDGGCRFPTCHAPAQHCDAHHVVPVDQDGPTVLGNLALLCNSHHHAVHDSNWTGTLDPDGSITFTRRGVTLTSVPRGERRFDPASPPPAGRPRRKRLPPLHGTTPPVPEQQPDGAKSIETAPEPLPF